MRMFENDGALFRGPSRAWPEEVWNERTQEWQKYTGKTPKNIEWGHYVDQAEADELMGKPTQPVSKK